MPLNTLPNYRLPSRVALESKHGALLKERLHWRNLVSYMGNHNELVLCWFKYKESFSARLVRRLIAELDLIEQIVMEAKN